MHAIVSLLDPTAYQMVENLWKMLDTQCGIEGSKTTPYPHLSWQVAEDYQIPTVARRLDQIAARAIPLLVHCTGLGLFTGPEPVLFINTVKDMAMIRFHARIWNRTSEYAIGPSQYYQPELWIPHITLAHRGLNQQTLACALNGLAFQPLDWHIRLDNLALVCQDGDEIGRLKDRWDFPHSFAEL